MFTGIVTDIGTITTAEQRGDLRLVIQCGYDMGGVDLGASIACSGCCLTVVDKGADWFAVDASAETVSKTAGGAMSWAGISSQAMSMVWAKCCRSNRLAIRTRSPSLPPLRSLPISPKREQSPSTAFR